MAKLPTLGGKIKTGAFPPGCGWKTDIAEGGGSAIFIYTMIGRLEICEAAALLILMGYLLVSINLRLRREVRAYKARQASFPVTYLDTSQLCPEITRVRATIAERAAPNRRTSRTRQVLLSLAHARIRCLGYFQDSSENSRHTPDHAC